ncbi:hypothetical protein EFP18_11120 [Burkholderia glumae]|nr:hypothetical protein EXE55_17230 [Burkholderia glumae]RQZ66167.1 hypothetical protein DF052_25950 [Burkholderia glumae]UVS84640.1 hypothetical protein EFP18_11120 [Burkholderia glumae]UVS98429.1 hypothetical protein EFP19_22225 [Burkholderia glumae]
MQVSKILELYARHGRSLLDNGLCEAALPVSEAGVALELFGQQRWRVLGGDVYHLTDDGRFESTYENWSYEGKGAAESVVVARDFIDCLAGRSVYIVFVVDDRE